MWRLYIGLVVALSAIATSRYSDVFHIASIEYKTCYPSYTKLCSTFMEIKRKFNTDFLICMKSGEAVHTEYDLDQAHSH